MPLRFKPPPHPTIDGQKHDFQPLASQPFFQQLFVLSFIFVCMYVFQVLNKKKNCECCRSLEMQKFMITWHLLVVLVVVKQKLREEAGR